MRNERKFEVAVLELEGSADELGFLQGGHLKIGPGFERMKVLQQHINTREATQLLAEFSPAFLQELGGLARGAGIGMKTAIQLFSCYNVVTPPMGCSTYANNTYYVRNYDFSDTLYDARFVFQKPASGYASVGFSHQILGRLDGMNERGLVIGLHFVNEQFKGNGFLATTICRLVLDQCATTEEAIALIEELPHRYCYNFSILDGSGNTVMIEAAPDKHTVHRSTPITCTNHFEVQEHKNRKGEMLVGSLNRKYNMKNLNVKKENPLNYYKSFNDENSPLFSNRYEDFFGTLHTVVYCPEDLSVIVGVGGNCEPYTFSFQEWMLGIEVLPEAMEGVIGG